MANPIIRINNGKEIIDREMTAAEFEQYQADQAAQVLRQAKTEANATAKAALLARLGITADEAKLLLG
jgi:hypothetical protein